jgi:hypothetical protein
MPRELVKLSTPYLPLVHLNSVILSPFGSGLTLPGISHLLLNSICK